MTNQKLIDIMALLQPHQAKGYNKIRIGRPGDGGYVHIDDFKDIKLAIGGGLSSDDTWELSMLEKNIPVIAFDHSSDYIFQNIDRGYTWYKLPMQGYGSNNSTLDLMLPLYADHSVIAKIDIEDDEWDMFRYTQLSNLNKFRQIVVEFHNALTTESALSTFRHLSVHFKVVHVHGNNCCPCYHYEGQNIPDGLELTFANKSYYNLSVSNETFPGILDTPNNLNAPDYNLGTFTL